MIKITTYNDNIDKFINDLRKELDRYNIKFIISIKKYVKLGQKDYCNGYFDNDKKELAIATGSSLSHWFPILVHESCHFEQWVKNCKPWRDYSNICDDNTFTKILDRESDMSNEEVREYLALSRDMELDCERRTIKKIKKYDLPIDINQYVKKAGSYVMFYNYMAEARKWYKIGKEPYRNDKIIELMPNNLNGDYSKLTQKLRNLYAECV